jgi:hypothetical protein
MGRSMTIIGFTSPENKNYKSHAMVLKAYVKANLDKLPKETAEYFGSEYPDECLLEERLEIKIPKHEYCGDMTEGFEIIISEIPRDVYKIRIVNSY